MSKKILLSLFVLGVLFVFTQFRIGRADETVVINGTIKKCLIGGDIKNGQLDIKNAVIIITLSEEIDKEFIADLMFLFNSGFAKKLDSKIKVDVNRGDKVRLTCRKQKTASEKKYQVLNLEKRLWSPKTGQYVKLWVRPKREDLT